MIHTRVLDYPTLLKGHTVVYGMVSLLVVYQEALHAATVMLISEIIVRAPTMGRNEPTVVCGTASLLVVSLEVLRVMTMLISEITARVLTRRMIEVTVVFGTVNPLVVFQEALRAAMIIEIIVQVQAMKRIIVSAEAIMARYFAGKVQFKYFVSTMSNLLQRILNKDRKIRNTTQHTSQFGRRFFVLVYDNNQKLNY